MFEVRLHGRGGAGVLTAARILSRAAFLEGYQTQDFAMYGAERRGAPVTSFVRFDKKKISERGYIFEPNVVIVLDETLNFSVMLSGLKSKGFMIINSNRKKEYFKKNFKIKHKFYCIPATDVALEVIGKPIANATLMGAVTKLLKIPLKTLEKAIEIELSDIGRHEVIEKNILATRKCYKMIK